MQFFISQTGQPTPTSGHLIGSKALSDIADTTMSSNRSLCKCRCANLLIATSCLITVVQSRAQNAPKLDDLPRTPASAEQVFTSYEGQNISAIQVAGQPTLSDTQFSSLFAQKVGDPFSNSKANQTANAIKATGKFK